MAEKLGTLGQSQDLFQIVQADGLTLAFRPVLVLGSPTTSASIELFSSAPPAGANFLPVWNLGPAGTVTLASQGSTVGYVTTGAPTYTNGTWAPFSLDTAGNLRTSASVTVPQPLAVNSMQSTGNSNFPWWVNVLSSVGVAIQSAPYMAQNGVSPIPAFAVMFAGSTGGGLPLVPFIYQPNAATSTAVPALAVKAILGAGSATIGTVNANINSQPISVNVSGQPISVTFSNAAVKITDGTNNAGVTQTTTAIGSGLYEVNTAAELHVVDPNTLTAVPVAGNQNSVLGAGFDNVYVIFDGSQPVNLTKAILGLNSGIGSGTLSIGATSSGIGISLTSAAALFVASVVSAGVFASQAGTWNVNATVTSTGSAILVHPDGGLSPFNLTQVGGAAVTLGQNVGNNSIPVAVASDELVALGQATMANSLPVAIASNQSYINTNTFSIQSSGNSSFPWYVNILSSAGVFAQQAGTWTVQQGGAPWSVTANSVGTVLVNQGTSPWTVSGSGTFTVSNLTSAGVFAQQAGTWNIGTLTSITQSVGVSALQAGAPWSVSGSGNFNVVPQTSAGVFAQQAGTWNIGTLTSITQSVGVSASIVSPLDASGNVKVAPQTSHGVSATIVGQPIQVSGTVGTFSQAGNPTVSQSLVVVQGSGGVGAPNTGWNVHLTDAAGGSGSQTVTPQTSAAVVFPYAPMDYQEQARTSVINSGAITSHIAAGGAQRRHWVSSVTVAASSGSSWPSGNIIGCHLYDGTTPIWSATLSSVQTVASQTFPVPLKGSLNTALQVQVDRALGANSGVIFSTTGFQSS